MRRSKHIESLNTQSFLRKRLLAVLMLITFIFTALFGRLMYIQLFRGSELQARALDQWTRDVPLRAPRGRITDISGIVLADTATEYTLYVRPNDVSDKEELALLLSEVFELDREKLLNKLNKRASEVTISKKVTKEQMQFLRGSGLGGMYFSEDIKRFYPFGDFASALLGFTDYDTYGQSGIELYYDEYLRGVDGQILSESDLVGRAKKDGKTYYIPYVSGLDLTLTIDYHIQSFAENAVREAMTAFAPKSVSCIIMDCNTGAVRAMAYSPSFDLNEIPRDDVVSLFEMSKNKATSTVYEPGSTFKILTAAIGLETGKFNENYSFFCPGYRMIDGQRIKCWRTIGHGSQRYGDGINNSCNCLFMDIATTVGTETMYDYFDALGLKEPTGIDYGGEIGGILIDETAVKTVDLARMGFGQAIAVTPLGLLSAACCVVNGGHTVTPYILEKAVDPKSGQIAYSHTEPQTDRIFSEGTSARMRTFLQGVVDEGGGKKAKVEGYSIGGKTGTAQKYENGAIASGKYISSFLGFSTVEDPRYAVLFIVDEPQGYLYYGSYVAAPFVGKILKSIFDYTGLKPYR